MTGAYGGSTGGTVCIDLTQGVAACDKTESEGIYIPGSGALQQAIIFHYGGTIKAYGLFFT
jgi:hypothetical protein